MHNIKVYIVYKVDLALITHYMFKKNQFTKEQKKIIASVVSGDMQKIVAATKLGVHRNTIDGYIASITTDASQRGLIDFPAIIKKY